MAFFPKIKNSKTLTSFILMLSISSVSYAVEFNVNIIDSKDRDNIDLSQFANQDYILPGDYLVDITLNGRKLPGQYFINYIEVDKENSKLCISDEMIQKFSLKKEIINEITSNSKDKCIIFPDNLNISFRFDKANQNLLFAVPQAWLEYDDPYWVPPSQWDNGITSAFLDYNVFLGYSKPKESNVSINGSSNGTAGINLGAWRFRADYQYQFNRVQNKTNERFDWTQLYVFRAYPELGAKILLGESYFKTNIFDSFRFLGLSLFSDDRMIPPSLRGYAPQITGIAKTNATVVISQNGRIIKKVKVVPGPFNITDITEAVQGTLDVAIEEENGVKTNYQVTAASLPFLTRDGQLSYKFSVGEPSSLVGSLHTKPKFISGEFSFGILSNTSLFSGIIASINNNYLAINTGIAQNMNQFGAISFDITRTNAKLNDFGNYSGNSYRLNYSKRFESTNSQVTFAGYKFTEKNYLTMPQFIDAENGSLDFRRDKNVYTASFNQYISPLDLTLYFNASHHQYWNSESATAFGLSLSKVFEIGNIKNISATLSINKIKYKETDDNQAYISFSIPFENGGSMNYDVQYANGGKDMSQSVAYFSRNIDDNYWSVRASGNNDQIKRKEPSISGSYQYSSPYGVLNVNGSDDINSYTALGGSWTGSLTATKYGAALHRNGTGNEPRLVIDSDNVAGISIDNGQSVTNSYGIGVATSLNSFSNSDVFIDMNTLPDDVDVNENIFAKTLTEGAVGYQKIRANQGKRILAVVRLNNGKYPPLGTNVIEINTGREAGIIGENGIVYLTGINPGEKYSVKWSKGAEQCSLHLDSVNEKSDSSILIPCS